jgi:hypothetical protein
MDTILIAILLLGAVLALGTHQPQSAPIVIMPPQSSNQKSDTGAVVMLLILVIAVLYLMR